MDKMREDFENEMIAYGYEKDEFFPDEETGCYADGELAAMWVGFKIGWKASRAALCVELPQQEKVPAEMSMSWQPFYKMMSSDVIKMLDDAGVKYK